ncbi:MAG: ABC transporter ATP-binding protein/permease [Treponema sp.]|nr:ABC transporter ATP-binding protein/permease [Treponema sp.]
MVNAANVIIPQFMRRAIDIITGGNFVLRDIIIPAASMVGLMVLISAGRFLWRFFINGAARRIEAQIRQNLFRHLLSLSYDFYQKNKIGDLMARATNDLNAIRESIGMGIVALIDSVVMLTAILIIIFIQDTRTAAWAVIPLPIITIFILFFGKVIGKRFRRSHEAYSSMSDVVQESFAGMRVIKSFVKEWWFIKKFSESNDEYRDANMALVRLWGIFFPLVTFLSGLTVLIVLLVGGIRVIEGYMTPGDLVALFSYLRMLIWPLMGAGFVVNMIQRGAISLSRINDIMKTVPSIQGGDEVSNDDEKPIIELKNLSFEYVEGKPVLEDISLSIKKGSILGILGKTGSGKSTLIKAITRMIDPVNNSGTGSSVYIKGIESSAWDLEELRQLFAVTPQDSYLFSDSIKNNIGYAGDSESDEEELGAAATKAAMDKDFTFFKNGWNALIGERGLTLSGGQKQRTAIARSIAANREILILDDSLSAVDAETETKILENLFNLSRDNASVTMILISHRVSTLARADHVIVLDKGAILEQGSPAELIALGGSYARTAALQSLGKDDG